MAVKRHALFVRRATMRRIGVLFGIENSFPGALVEEINLRNVPGVRAEFVEVGVAPMEPASGEMHYAVIVDRISHQIPFYRSYLKVAALSGTTVINNPFWQSADDKFLNYALAARLGVAVPPTMLVPHKLPPNGTTERSLRNIEFPLNWDRVFLAVGEHGFLKPIDGGGWRDVYEVRGRDEFFRIYEQTRELCMVYQQAVDFDAYFRCCVVGQKWVRTMAYDPRRPHEERYVPAWKHVPKSLIRGMERDAVTLCRALGYDVNTVEFALADGIAYAIDFMNPVPDADPNSVGRANFTWIVEQVADLAIAKALAPPQPPELRAAVLLGAQPQPAKRKRKKTSRKSVKAEVLAKLESKS
jgi:hypothetical protein